MYEDTTNIQIPPGPQGKDSMSPVPIEVFVMEVPFVIMRSYAATIPELLGFRHQLDDKTASLFTKTVFKWQLMLYTDQTETPWEVKAAEVILPQDLHFVMNGGLLEEDWKHISLMRVSKTYQMIWE